MTNRQHVLHAISENCPEDWNGCVRSGKCCGNYSVYPESVADPDFWEYIDKVHNGNIPLKVKEYMSKSVEDKERSCFSVETTCSQLTNNNGCMSCKIYNNRPKTCQEYLCEDAIERGKMFKKYNETGSF